MKITYRKPNTWEELQDYVAKYFNEAGYIATSPKKINLSRGSAEVDVYVEAKEELGGEIICECKYWASSIPQEKIHAFRTIVHESGANLGLFITSSKFQSGAVESASYSNIKLLTWDDFLEFIYDKWVIKKCLEIRSMSKPLGVYTDMFDVDINMLSEDGKKEFLSTFVDNSYIYSLAFFNFNIECNSKKANNSILEKISELNSKEHNIDSIEEFFDFVESKIKKSIKYYENLFGDYIIELNKKVY